MTEDAPKRGQSDRPQRIRFTRDELLARDPGIHETIPTPPPAPPPAPDAPQAVAPAAATPATTPAAGTPPPSPGAAPSSSDERRTTSKRFLEAMSHLLGTDVEAPPRSETVRFGAPALLDADPLTPERFQTKTKKLLAERLARPTRKYTPTDRTPAVRVEALEAVYEDHQVLFGLDFTVRRGEILAILGGSGSGKTTLLKHLIGLLRPSRGTIEISGQDISKLEGDDLALILKSTGMLFQYSALFNSMTIAENVALPLREYTDLPDAAIKAIVRLKLCLVGLPGVGDRLPNELSGGMKKRAALARALALDPDVLFFDEPGSGLDPIAAAALDQLILHLNRSFGTTMVIVTHDLENAFNVAHRILMLDQGRIRKIGTPTEVKASADPWVKSFLARSTAIRDAVDEDFFKKLGIVGKGKPS
jgi:phospholipid/cholesterol/gamma-HCH transport system ATP-binding protein